MNWAKLIKGNGSVDLQSMPYYSIKFTSKSEIQEVYGYSVILPEAPPDEYCVNFNLPIEQQIFRRIWIPEDLMQWKRHEADAFIDGEYNRRFQGCWYFIKGKKYYITGPFYFFYVIGLQ